MSEHQKNPQPLLSRVVLETAVAEAATPSLYEYTLAGISGLLILLSFCKHCRYLRQFPFNCHILSTGKEEDL